MPLTHVAAGSKHILQHKSHIHKGCRIFIFMLIHQLVNILLGDSGIPYNAECPRERVKLHHSRLAWGTNILLIVKYNTPPTAQVPSWTLGNLVKQNKVYCQWPGNKIEPFITSPSGTSVLNWLLGVPIPSLAVKQFHPGEPQWLMKPWQIILLAIFLLKGTIHLSSKNKIPSRVPIRHITWYGLNGHSINRKSTVL